MFDSFDTFDHRWLDSHRYALIDAQWREDLPPRWTLAVVAPAHLGDDTARCPVLLDLRTLSADDLGGLLAKLAEQVAAREDALCSLLLAHTGETSAVVEHLARRMVLTLPGDPTLKQWRYFDPGTFLQLPRLLGEQGLAWLMGKASSVIVPWAGQWSQVNAPARQRPGFRLGAGHLAALARLGAVNRAVLPLEQPSGAKAWAQTCASADAHVLRAMTSHGLTQQADLVAFASHAMLHHPRFDQHPRLQTLFQSLKTATPEDEIDYRELSSPLTPEDWQRIAADLRSSAQPGSKPEGTRS